jgi:hypothetical protein
MRGFSTFEEVRPRPTPRSTRLCGFALFDCEYHACAFGVAAYPPGVTARNWPIVSSRSVMKRSAGRKSYSASEHRNRWSSTPPACHHRRWELRPERDDEELLFYLIGPPR